MIPSLFGNQPGPKKSRGDLLSSLIGVHKRARQEQVALRRLDVNTQKAFFVNLGEIIYVSHVCFDLFDHSATRAKADGVKISSALGDGHVRLMICFSKKRGPVTK